MGLAVDAIKAKARGLGFDRVGVCRAEPTAYREYWERWLAEGRAGEMAYLADRVAERLDPGVYFPGVRSVVCVAKNYAADLAAPPPGVRGKVARYALGEDYHEVIKPRLWDLADWMRDAFSGSDTVCGVDTVPVPERELAARAGVGWIGKNTMLIAERTGSWLLLGEVLTTLDLPADEPGVDRCGTCTRCLDACPTGAITAPYQLDASRCVSYLTIEHQGPISDPALRAGMGQWLYGCDICQDVCPHNSGDARPVVDPKLAPRPGLASGTLDAEAVRQWTTQQWQVATRRSAMRRAGVEQFRRNAEIVVENAHAAGTRPADAERVPEL